MFEYHGWINIWEGSSEEEDDDALLERNIEEIKTKIESIEKFNSVIDMLTLNGATYIRLDGDRNHTMPDIIDLFIEIGNIAKGSHGLLYIRDDENPNFPNEFQVWKMARGKVSLEKDQLLSPCDPIIETYG